MSLLPSAILIFILKNNQRMNEPPFFLFGIKKINFKIIFFFFCKVRGFAAQASTKSKASAEIESSTLQNNVVVASVDSHSPIARVSICFR